MIETIPDGLLMFWICSVLYATGEVAMYFEQDSYEDDGVI